MRKNEDRAAAGKEAMDFYSEQIGYDETRDETDSLTDLLADLMHTYGHRAMKHCSRIALEHYQFEIAEELEQ
tara:strand:- start:224 stop:439 length:216 start_codon:yes stop_codon:yes gene_type:complete